MRAGNENERSYYLLMLLPRLACLQPLVFIIGNGNMPATGKRLKT